MGRFLRGGNIGAFKQVGVFWAYERFIGYCFLAVGNNRRKTKVGKHSVLRMAQSRVGMGKIGMDFEKLYVIRTDLELHRSAIFNMLRSQTHLIVS